MKKKIDAKYQSYEKRAYAIAASQRETALINAYKLYEDEMEKFFAETMLITKKNLEKHHILAKDKSLAEFREFPRIKVAELEKSSLKELEREIGDTYTSYTKRTIQESLKEVAVEIAVPCCLTSATAVAGVAVGSTLLALSGGAISICVVVGLKLSQPKPKKLKSS